MNTLVVYDSQYGNTAQIAQTIAARLKARGNVRSINADDSAGLDLTGVDLLVIGGPTQAHGPRQPLRVWIDGVLPEALRGVAVATFDTRLRWLAFLSGSAARTAARTLRRKGDGSWRRRRASS
jgi:flavodoxin